MGTQLDLDDVAAGHPLAEQELAELRKDAERYRWLKYDGDRNNKSYIARPLGVHGLGFRLYTHNDLDAEIEHSRTVQKSCATGTAMNGANRPLNRLAD